jgi:hypothetical protein
MGKPKDRSHQDNAMREIADYVGELVRAQGNAPRDHVRVGHLQVVAAHRAGMIRSHSGDQPWPDKQNW